MALILLTNDDGYDAAGLQSLYRELRKEHDVFVSGDVTERSG